jgi:hypothetical protein
MEQMLLKWNLINFQIKSLGRSRHSEFCAALWVDECEGILTIAAKKCLKFAPLLFDD